MWKKGQSGNPGGRPQLAKAWEVATGKKMAEVTAEALKLVWERAQQGAQPNHFGDPNDPDWRFAMQKVLEYSAGKPKETVEIVGDGERPFDWSKVPAERRQMLLAALTELEAVTGDGEADEPVEH